MLCRPPTGFTVLLMFSAVQKSVGLTVNDTNFSLLNIDLFSGLPDSDLEALAGRCRWRRYAPDQQIIGHQDETTDVYFVASGRVRVTVYSPSGKEVSFRDLGAGKSFGELSAVDGGPRSANVIALTETLLASLPGDTFRRILIEHPELATRMMGYLAGLIRKLSDRVVEFSVLAVRNRIHAELLRLARDHGVDGNRAIVSPAPTHANFATRVSTHRERVTRELNALSRDGLLRQRRGELVVLDVDRLAQLVESGLEE